jgi:hypothetical protein
MSITIDKTSSGHDRRECFECGKVLVRQPYMGGLKWISDLTKFTNEHDLCVTRATSKPAGEPQP